VRASALVRHGPICLITIHRFKPATDGSSKWVRSGVMKGYSKRWLQICNQEALSTFERHLSMAVLPLPKKGAEGRRLRRRWKIERLFAWLQNFRRLVVRYEHHAENFLGMLHLGCCVILLRYL